MSNKQNINNSDSRSALPEANSTAQLNRKPYETPVLISFGDVRDVTLGPTVGIGESGAELGFRNP